MKKQFPLSALVLCFALGAAQFTHAQNLTLDDFSTGVYKQTLPTSTAISDQNIQTGNMIVGSRDPFYFVCHQVPCNAAENPFGQNATVKIGRNTGGISSALVFSSGYKIVPDPHVFYGSNAPLQLNLNGYNRLRVTFDGLTQIVNFNLELYSPTGNGQLGCNLPPLTPLSFTEDFPLADFVPNTIDFGNISRVALLTESGEYAVAKFEAILSSDKSKATFTCTTH